MIYVRRVSSILFAFFIIGLFLWTGAPGTSRGPPPRIAAPYQWVVVSLPFAGNDDSSEMDWWTWWRSVACRALCAFGPNSLGPALQLHSCSGVGVSHPNVYFTQLINPSKNTQMAPHQEINTDMSIIINCPPPRIIAPPPTWSRGQHAILAPRKFPPEPNMRSWPGLMTF